MIIYVNMASARAFLTGNSILTSLSSVNVLFNFFKVSMNNFLIQFLYSHTQHRCKCFFFIEHLNQLQTFPALKILADEILYKMLRGASSHYASFSFFFEKCLLLKMYDIGRSYWVSRLRSQNFWSMSMHYLIFILKKNGQSDDATKNLQSNFKKMTNLNLKIIKIQSPHRHKENCQNFCQI